LYDSPPRNAIKVSRYISLDDSTLRFNASLATRLKARAIIRNDLQKRSWQKLLVCTPIKIIARCVKGKKKQRHILIGNLEYGFEKKNPSVGILTASPIHVLKPNVGYKPCSAVF